MHKACQQRTGRSQGACLTQWDCKLEPHRMQQFKGTQMTSAVIWNRELSSHSVFRATIPSAIVSSRRGEWLRGAERQREGESEAKRGSLPIDPGCLEPAFVFIRSSPGSPGRVWRTALCMPVYYVIPITQQKPQCSAPHLPLIQRDENTYSPIAYRHEFVTPHTSGGEMKIIKMKYTKKERQPNQIGGKVHLEFCHGWRAVFLSQIKGTDS